MSEFESQYARALADVVDSERLEPATIDGQLQLFLGAFTESRELREALVNPAIEFDEKLKVLDALSARFGMTKQVRNFLAILLKNDRIQSLSDVIAEYRKEMDLRLKRGIAEIVSTRELTPEEKSQVEAKAAGLAGVSIRPIYRQDPLLLGGIVIRIGDTVYDGSVRGSLDKLREKLLAG